MGFLTSFPFVWGGGTRVTGEGGETKVNGEKKNLRDYLQIELLCGVCVNSVSLSSASYIKRPPALV